MVEIKFLVEVVLVAITLVVVLWWIYTNYNSLVVAFQNWVADVMGWG